jgi:hypothetical protein
MYRRSKFLEVLLDLRQEMAREADYDVDLFAEMIRSGRISKPVQKSDGGAPELSARRRRSSSRQASSE